MHMKNKEKGFTLIELLVVIAIIGILATIVLTSLGSARGKATDAKAQATLSGMRAQAELYYTAHNDYGSASTDCGIGGATSGNMFNDSDDTTNSLAGLIAGLPSGYNPSCHSTGTAWAVAAYNGSGGAWCVDSNGDSKAYTSASGDDVTGLTVCPASF